MVFGVFASAIKEPGDAKLGIHESALLKVTSAAFAITYLQVIHHEANMKRPRPAEGGADQVSTRVVRYNTCTLFRRSCGCSSPSPSID